MEKSYVGMTVCFWCNKETGIVLDRRLRNTLERRTCYNYAPPLVMNVKQTSTKESYVLK